MAGGPAGRIALEGLRVLGRHGVLEEEKERPQPFEIDLDIEVDLDEAARGDDLGATVDYGVVTEKVTRLVAGESYELMEALALAIAEAVLGEPRAKAVTVKVRKLRPPVAADLSSAAVVLTRRRD